MSGPEFGKVKNINRPVGATEKIRVSADQLNDFLDRDKPSERSKSAKRRRDVARHLLIEEGERNVALLDLESQLDIENDNEFKVLSDEEKNALRKIIRSYPPEDYKDMCQGTMRSIRDRVLFRAKFDQWEKLYFYKKGKTDIDNVNHRDDEEFKEFIKSSGISFIKANRNLIVADSLESFVKNNNVDPEFTDDDVEKLTYRVNSFIDDNFDNLLSDDENVKNQSFDKFVLIMRESGFDDGSENMKLKIKALYDKLLLTIDFQYLSEIEFEGLSSKMIENVDSSMTDEEWDIMLNDINKETFNKGVNEVLNENRYLSDSGGFSVFTDDGLYTSIESFARVSGVVLRPVSGQEGVYVVDSDKITDKSYLPYLRVRDDGKFEMEMQFADEGEKFDGDSLNGHGSKKFSYKNFKSAVNMQILDYAMNVSAVKGFNESIKKDPNTSLKDEQMKKVAEMLFGFSLNDRALSLEHVARFVRISKVLMRDNGKSMASRINTLLNFISDPNNASALFNTLGTEGQVSHNIDGIIDFVRFSRANPKQVV